MTPEEIKAEYLKLRELYRSLVGTLYPSIVYGQLLDLRDRYAVASGQHGWGDLPHVPPPRSDGSAPYFG